MKPQCSTILMKAVTHHGLVEGFTKFYKLILTLNHNNNRVRNLFDSITASRETHGQRIFCEFRD